MKTNKKTETINLRVSSEQKKFIRKTAESLGMDISKFLVHQAYHGEIVVIEGGKELAAEVYELNQRLNRLESYPFVDVQKLRDTVSEGILRINEGSKGGKQYVDIEF